MDHKPLTLRDIPHLVAGWFGFIAALISVGLLAWLISAAFKQIGLWGEAANLAGIVCAFAAVLWVGMKIWR
jgi:hypothetical protein